MEKTYTVASCERLICCLAIPRSRAQSQWSQFSYDKDHEFSVASIDSLEPKQPAFLDFCCTVPLALADEKSVWKEAYSNSLEAKVDINNVQEDFSQ